MPIPPETLQLIVDTIPTMVWTALPDGSRDFINRRWLEYTGLTLEQGLGTEFAALHPEDRSEFLEAWKAARSAGAPLEIDVRLRRADGEYRWFEHRVVPLLNPEGEIGKWFAITTDIQDRRTAGEALREHARQLQQIMDIVPLHMFTWEADASASYGNRAAREYFGISRPLPPTAFLDLVVHPEDIEKLKKGIQDAMAFGEAFEMEARMRRHDGEYRWFLYSLIPLRDDKGQITRWYGTRIDISEPKRAEEALREHLRQIEQIVDLVPQQMVILSPDFSTAYGNLASREFFGPREWISPTDFLKQTTHPDDLERLLAWLPQSLTGEGPREIEARGRRRDGQYRWLLHQFTPLRDDRGNIARWCLTRIDIEERKQNEERTLKENLALREEVDKISMFEEIVGTSGPLQAVLARVSKVARTDSTVLITGETGTGKELIARAIHKRSQRSARAFVSVNCAAIPRDLIASELFGHEKGAFTGALQRRLGRFELAEGGTIFLDEVGELPAETQVALLRVLQEREFERVGGNQPIRVDTRVIAATNRDLRAAIADSSFRSDLFYRINVFPIEIPPLRERKDDIRLLVEYFIDRYSSKMGKKFRTIDRNSLARLQSDPWPGNIRELQNIIERSVIVCETDYFSIDESWLSRTASGINPPLAEGLLLQEKQRIEAVLTETRGRVSGPTGAAAKLGMPPSTLDSRIKALRIDKRRF